MFSYFAYGLGVHSTIPLPEFIPAEVECDVLFYQGHPDQIPMEARGKFSYLDVNEQQVIISGEGVGTFIITRGKEVCIIPEREVEHSRIRLNLVGVVMAFVLYQRGLLVLHAACNSMKGGAVGFIGESGFGKSSMAVALYLRGFSLLTDDVLAIETAGDFPIGYAGFPQVKLDPESAVSLNIARDRLHELHSSQQKLGLRLATGFESSSLPLRCLYILGQGDSVVITPLSPSQSLIELVRNSYPTRALQCGGAAHLQKCAAIANRIPIYLLSRPKRLSLLPTIAELVEQHVMGLEAPSKEIAVDLPSAVLTC